MTTLNAQAGMLGCELVQRDGWYVQWLHTSEPEPRGPYPTQRAALDALIDAEGLRGWFHPDLTPSGHDQGYNTTHGNWGRTDAEGQDRPAWRFTGQPTDTERQDADA
jgi:hypothetical protein